MWALVSSTKIVWLLCWLNSTIVWRSGSPSLTTGCGHGGEPGRAPLLWGRRKGVKGELIDGECIRKNAISRFQLIQMSSAMRRQKMVGCIVVTRQRQMMLDRSPSSNKSMLWDRHGTGRLTPKQKWRLAINLKWKASSVAACWTAWIWPYGRPICDSSSRWAALEKAKFQICFLALQTTMVIPGVQIYDSINFQTKTSTLTAISSHCFCILCQRYGTWVRYLWYNLLESNATGWPTCTS